MSNASSSRLALERSTATGRNGAVAGKMRSAVDAGTAILAEGGNAFDAAVATAFAMGVAEPWMNGIGGGGFLVGWLAAEKRAFTIEYPMISPSGATEDMFPLESGIDAGLFGWPSTKGNENVLGYRSIAIPGTVAGLTLALERYGTFPLARVLRPAIDLAEQGIAVTWHSTLTITKDLANLLKFGSTADIYLTANGLPPATLDGGPTAVIRNPDLARTLRAIAEGGAPAFYEGAIAETIVNHLAANGTPVTLDDFASYRAIEEDALTSDFSGHQIHTMGKGSGGTSLTQALGIIERLQLSDSQHNSADVLHQYDFAFRQAFADRFTYLADPEHVEVPVETMLSAAYLDARAAAYRANGLAPVQPGSKEALGVAHGLDGSVGEYMRDGSTTHLGVIDKDGNAVAITQTLLSGWGSRVTVPGTGVLMNNGMMWFDPEPGRPNSIGPCKRPLSNMAPVLVTRNGQIRASIGSSGGRKIMNCNAQIIANLTTHHLPIGEALAAPRIDASTRALSVSSRMDPAVIDDLASRGHPVAVVDETLFAGGFASPVAISRDDDGTLEAAADAWYFPAVAYVLP